LGTFKNRLTKKEIINLFLLAAFPIHAWAIILVLRDFQWVYDQMGMSVFIGYASYTLVFAFFESVIFLVFLWLLSYLFPPKWAGTKSFSILALWALTVSLWAVGNQVFYLLMESPPGFMSWIMLRVYYHQGLGFSLLMILIFISVILPLILVLRFDNFEKLIARMFKQITTLSAFYLIFDLLGLITVIIRNLSL
jgi:hypothetical protein